VEATEPADEARYVEDFTLRTHDGGEIKLSDALEDGPVILDFWATGCTPCRHAMPIYAELATKYADKGVRFLPVSLDTKKAQSKIAPLFEKQGWKFVSLLDPTQEIASALHVLSLPTMFLVDQDRRIVATHIGFRPDMKEGLERELQDLIKAHSQDDASK